MKEATGDMTMTIVVIVGIIAVLALGRVIWGIIGDRLTSEVEEIGNEETAVVEIYNTVL